MGPGRSLKKKVYIGVSLFAIMLLELVVFGINCYGASDSVLRTRELIITDSIGRDRIKMGTDSTGAASIVFTSASNDTILMVRVEDDSNARIVFGSHTPNGDKLTVGISDNAASAIFVRGFQVTAITAGECDLYGSEHLRINDSEIALFPRIYSDTGMLYSLDRDWRLGLGGLTIASGTIEVGRTGGHTVMIAGGEGGCSIDLYSDKRKRRISLYASKTSSAFNLSDVDGSLRAIVGTCDIKQSNGQNVKMPESSINLFNSKGQGLFAAP